MVRTIFIIEKPCNLFLKGECFSTCHKNILFSKISCLIPRTYVSHRNSKLHRLLYQRALENLNAFKLNPGAFFCRERAIFCLFCALQIQSLLPLVDIYVHCRFNWTEIASQPILFRLRQCIWMIPFMRFSPSSFRLRPFLLEVHCIKRLFQPEPLK